MRNALAATWERGAATASMPTPHQVLVLDEPTNGLDPQGTREVRGLLVELAEGGATVVLSTHLLSEGYKDAAAVLIGAVLEDTVRKRTEREGLLMLDAKGRPLTIDPMNTALAKKGIYNVLVQKQVTAWADLRNKAAHAHWDQYDKDQVVQMLAGVRKFCADYL